MNLVELGIARIRLAGHELQLCSANQFLGLIKCNSNLKILHIPTVVPDMFIDYVAEHPEVEYRLEGLSFTVLSFVT